MGGVLQRSRIGMLALGRAQPRLKRGVGARARIKHAGGGWDGRGGGGGHSREHLCACGTAGRGAGARGSSGLRDERRRGRRGPGGWRIIFIDRGQSTVTHINQNTGLHAAGQPRGRAGTESESQRMAKQKRVRALPLEPYRPQHTHIVKRELRGWRAVAGLCSIDRRRSGCLHHACAVL